MKPLPDYCDIHTVETQARPGDEIGGQEWPEDASALADETLASEGEFIEEVNRIIDSCWK